MKKIVLLSGKLELSGSTTWLIALHEAIGELGADVVHIVIGEKSQVSPGRGRIFYTGKVVKRGLLKYMRTFSLHKLFPRFFAAKEDAEYARRVGAVLDTLAWHEKDVFVIKDFSTYTPANFRGGAVLSVIHHVLDEHEKQLGMLDERYYCSNLVAVSNAVADAAMRLDLPVDAVILNPMSAESVRSRAMEFKPPLDFGYIVFAGRLHETKGVLELLEAFARLSPDVGVKLVYVGDGKAREAIAKLAASLDLSDRVVLAGYQGNPYPYMAGARLLVLPSRSEAMGYVLMEAAALDVPCITAGFPAAYEFLEPDAIVPLSDGREAFVEALAEKMEWFLREPRVLVKDGVLARMAPKQVAGEYLALAGRSVQ